MAMIGAAAASDQLQIGQRWQEFRVLLGELGYIADIDLRGGIELGVTLAEALARKPPMRPTQGAPPFTLPVK
jgi:hypothetical protein